MVETSVRGVRWQTSRVCSPSAKPVWKRSCSQAGSASSSLLPLHHSFYPFSCRRHDSSGSGQSAFEPLVANGAPASLVPK